MPGRSPVELHRCVLGVGGRPPLRPLEPDVGGAGFPEAIEEVRDRRRPVMEVRREKLEERDAGEGVVGPGEGVPGARLEASWAARPPARGDERPPRR